MANILDIEGNLDSYIARYIRKTLFKDGMEFNSRLRKFEPVKPVPTNLILRQIEDECCLFFGITEAKRTIRVLKSIEHFRKRVQETTSFEPVKELKQGSIAPKSIATFQHIYLKEGEAGAYINLLPIGEGHFMVMDTNRSTLKSGDILETITTPWNTRKNDGFEFNIFRDGEKFIPEELPKTTDFINYQIEYKFKTQSINELWFYHAPEIQTIVDANINELTKISPKSQSFSKNYTLKFIEQINLMIDVEVIDNEHYSTLLDYCYNKCGVSSYVLNRVIELLDKKRHSTGNPVFASADWQSNIPKEIIIEIKKKEKEYKEKQVVLFRADYLKDLKEKLQQGRFYLIFKRSGYYNEQSEKELKDISDKLESLAEDGFGLKTWAESEKNDYLRAHQVAKKDNIIIAIKAIAFIVVAVAIIFVAIMTRNGHARFSESKKIAKTLINEKKYKEAKKMYIEAFSNYSPSITSFTIKSKYTSGLEAIEAAIDEDFEKSIASIKARLDADNGKFKEATEKELFRLLELRPEDADLLLLKAKWIKQ